MELPPNTIRVGLGRVGKSAKTVCPSFVKSEFVFSFIKAKQKVCENIGLANSLYLVLLPMSVDSVLLVQRRDPSLYPLALPTRLLL